jgi:hypothetical protein
MIFLWIAACLLNAGLAAAADGLTVSGADGKSRQVTAAELEKLPRRTVQAGEKASFEGVALTDVLRLAEAPLGDKLGHGDPPTWYVVVEAKDGYRALFALPELDPAFSDALVVLADRKNGSPLSAEEGPWLLVVPGEKRQARWVRQVTGLRIGHL